jgi:hypothetical protein
MSVRPEDKRRNQKKKKKKNRKEKKESGIESLIQQRMIKRVPETIIWYYGTEENINGQARVQVSWT